MAYAREIYRKAYLLSQEKMGLLVDDIVIIAAKSASKQFGWDNMWTLNMTRRIGNTERVKHIDGNRGIRLEGGGEYFPFYVLKTFE